MDTSYVIRQLMTLGSFGFFVVGSIGAFFVFKRFFFFVGFGKLLRSQTGIALLCVLFCVGAGIWYGSNVVAENEQARHYDSPI